MEQNKKKTRPLCPECGSNNTYVSEKPKQGKYVYCNHCGHEEWKD